MTLQKNDQPGRNEPWREDHIRMKILAHLFLTQVHQLTGKPAVAVADEVLKNYPPEHEIKMIRDRAKGLFLFAALPGFKNGFLATEPPVIEAPRRIVLPHGRVG